MPVRNRLVIMAKYPSAGRVKTRLARDIGVSEALRFYRHQLAHTCRTLANDRRWQLILSRSPDHERRSVQLPVDKIIGQGSGGLGTRMQTLFERERSGDDRGPLIIVGADIPGITPTIIGRAFHLLKTKDFVFGPADDGGYWLVGQRRMPRIIKAFDNVRWSSQNALTDTLENLRDCSVDYVDQLNDIDTGADLVR